MKLQLLLASVAVAAAAAGTASAAPVYNWTGFYIGANVGGGWGDSRWSDVRVISDSGENIPGEIAHNTPDGVIGGGQVGYNRQFENWVFGAEGKISAGSLSGGTGCIGNYEDYTANCRTHLDVAADFTARLGWAFGPVLFYGKGGFAVGNIHFTPEMEHARFGGFEDRVPPGYGTTTDLRVGLAAGAGVEFAVARHWSLGVEYEYQDYGSNRVNFNPLNPKPGDEIDLSPPFSATTSFYTHLVEAKINYRF
jgi:outer membrane immunogenic protein